MTLLFLADNGEKVVDDFPTIIDDYMQDAIVKGWKPTDLKIHDRFKEMTRRDSASMAEALGCRRADDDEIPSWLEPGRDPFVAQLERFNAMQCPFRILAPNTVNECRNEHLNLTVRQITFFRTDVEATQMLLANRAYWFLGDDTLVLLDFLHRVARGW